MHTRSNRGSDTFDHPVFGVCRDSCDHVVDATIAEWWPRFVERRSVIVSFARDVIDGKDIRELLVHDYAKMMSVKPCPSLDSLDEYVLGRVLRIPLIRSIATEGLHKDFFALAIWKSNGRLFTVDGSHRIAASIVLGLSFPMRILCDTCYHRQFQNSTNR